MIKLNLTVDEQELLVTMIENALTELHDEIANTDNYEYKIMLKARKALLLKLLASIKEGKQEPLAA